MKQATAPFIILSFVFAGATLVAGGIVEHLGRVESATGSYTLSAALVVAGGAFATGWPIRSRIDIIAVFGPMVIVVVAGLLTRWFVLPGLSWGIVVLLGGLALTIATLRSRKASESVEVATPNVCEDFLDGLLTKRDEQEAFIQAQVEEITRLKAAALAETANE